MVHLFPQVTIISLLDNMKLGLINTTLKRNYDNRAIPTADRQVERNTLGDDEKESCVNVVDDALKTNDLEQVLAQSAPHRDSANAVAKNSNDIRKTPNIANIM